MSRRLLKERGKIKHCILGHIAIVPRGYVPLAVSLILVSPLNMQNLQPGSCRAYLEKYTVTASSIFGFKHGFKLIEPTLQKLSL